LLAAEIAHEIRNPLTVMKMLHHSLDLNFPDDDPRRTDVRIMGEKMDHLNRIVDQVLDFARRTEPAHQLVNVNQLLDDLTLLTRHKLKAQSVELIRRLAPELPAIHGDLTQLEQAFLNLTLNAVEAMPTGGSSHDSVASHLAGRPGQTADACLDPVSRYGGGYDPRPAGAGFHFVAEYHQGAGYWNWVGHRGPGRGNASG